MASWEERQRCDALLERFAVGTLAEQLECCRLLQRTVLTLLQRSPQDDPDALPAPTDDTTLSPGDDAGELYLRRMLQLLRSAPSLPVGTLLLNLLAVVVRLRPTASLPIAVSALMELWERGSLSSSAAPSASVSSSTDPRSFMHGLALLLTTLTSLPQAEKYWPVIDEALKPTAASASGEPREKRARLSKASVPAEPPADSSPDASADLQDDTERQQLRAALDVTRLPADIVADLLIAVLPTLNDDRLPLMLGRWRPQLGGSAGSDSLAVNRPSAGPAAASQLSPMADPRKRRPANAVASAQASPAAPEIPSSELQALVLSSLRQALCAHASRCPEHLALLCARLLALPCSLLWQNGEDSSGSRAEGANAGDSNGASAGADHTAAEDARQPDPHCLSAHVLATIREFLVGPDQSDSGSAGQLQPEEPIRRQFAASLLRALWLTFWLSDAEEDRRAYGRLERWLLLRVVLAIQPHWLPSLVDQLPRMHVSLVHACADALLLQASASAAPEIARSLETLAVDVLVTAVLSRQGRHLPDVWPALARGLQGIAGQGVQPPQSSQPSPSASLVHCTVDGLGRLYGRGIAKDDIERLALSHRELWYGLLRIDPAMLVRTHAQLVPPARIAEEREPIGRALAKSPHLAVAVQRSLLADSEYAALWLLVLTACAGPRTLAPLVPWLAEQIGDGVLDGCFGAAIVLARDDNAERRRAFMAGRAWARMLQALLASPLACVLAHHRLPSAADFAGAAGMRFPDALPAPLAPGNGAVGSSDALLPPLAADDRAKLVAKWAGRLVELQYVGTADLLVLLHVRAGDLGGTRTAHAAIRALMGQPAWRAPAVLAAALTSVCDQQSREREGPADTPVLFYRTLLAAAQSSLLTKSTCLSLLVRSFKGRPWDVQEPPAGTDTAAADESSAVNSSWEGIVAVVCQALPESAVAALQLPMEQLRACLQLVPGARVPLRDYLNQQPPSYRNRFRDIFPLLAAASAAKA